MHEIHEGWALSNVTMKIICVQANLFYDLKTSGSTSFTYITFYDYFNHENTKFDGRYDEIVYH